MACRPSSLLSLGGTTRGCSSTDLLCARAQYENGKDSTRTHRIRRENVLKLWSLKRNAFVLLCLILSVTFRILARQDSNRIDRCEIDVGKKFVAHGRAHHARLGLTLDKPRFDRGAFVRDAVRCNYGIVHH